MAYKSIKDWSEEERPRERLLRHGPGSMSDAQFACDTAEDRGAPSGDPTPSRDDILITAKLETAGETAGIRVLDHIIIGEGQFVSMREKGYLKGK